MTRWTAVFVAVLSVGCSKAPQEDHDGHGKEEPGHHDEHAEHAGEHKDEEGHEQLPRRVQLSKEVIEAAKIRSEPVRRETLATGLSLSGELTADPDRSARVASPVSGRIESVTFQEGSAVKKGDALSTIGVPELGRLRAESASVASRATAARANAQRLEQLFEKRLAAEQDLVDAQAEADALETEAKGLKEHLGALGGTGAPKIVLRAPVSGTVVLRNAVVGQPVTPDQTIASIADLSEVWFMARVFEKDLGKLTVGASAEVALNAYPDKHFPGTVEYLGKQIDPVARTLTARIRLKNQDELLRLGLLGTARVATEDKAEGPGVLVVPRTALSEIGGKQVVFVQHEDGHFELHELVIGKAGLGKVEVLSGLREGEQVVVEGTFSVKSALLRSSFAEDGHGH